MKTLLNMDPRVYVGILPERFHFIYSSFVKPIFHTFILIFLRYCRITASKVYETSKCRTSDGSLTNTLFGASKLRDSMIVYSLQSLMSRGRKLQPLVLKQVRIKTKMQFERCGLFLSSDHPVFGASPDGICSTHVLEIKCPLTAKTK